MSGIYQGVQTRIIGMNPLAVYVPCSAHSLNLVLEHAAAGTQEIVRFFMFIQNIYVFFSKSTRRDILNNHLKIDLEKRKQKDPKIRQLFPKRLSDTRWSARDDACRALKTGYAAFPAALMEIFNNPDEKKISQVEAESLYKNFYKLETAILLEFWSNILHKANGVSKSLQNLEIDIRTAVYTYKSLTSYIQNLRSEKLFSEFEENSKILIQSCPDWE
ncbi:uncharacterized protein LOC119081987 [Bradysia coprophila]|uniref:uncharacterized protein LOC119081987 n=1 Tax=Bradysia coprophila TaxID=38358 RepID=UPI00187DC441|nr:uncharacterized protein LOC119081987 [Bradysia coprophila]